MRKWSVVICFFPQNCIPSSPPVNISWPSSTVSECGSADPKFGCGLKSVGALASANNLYTHNTASWTQLFSVTSSCFGLWPHLLCIENMIGCAEREREKEIETETEEDGEGECGLIAPSSGWRCGCVLEEPPVGKAYQTG